MAQSTRTSRIEARVTPQVLRAVKRAAEIQGRSVSDFMVTAAHEAANRTIEDAHIIRLSLADQRAVAEALANPPEPTPAWRRAVRSYRKLVKT